MKPQNNRPLRLLAAALAVCLLLPLTGCGKQEPEPQPATEVERLSKLCRVWGYVKYTHPAFLLGEQDWDEELLTLIPQVRELETEQEVNALLHEWFMGLGEIDYGTNKPVKFWAEAAAEDRLVITDTAWTTDTEYLGEELAGDLGRLGEIPAIKRTKAPACSVTGGDVLYEFYQNETEPTGSCEDPAFRLLGLFRMWNAVEYYFPYLMLMDRDWESCLTEYIPPMLEGPDQWSYEQTLAACSAHLRDPHISIGGGELSSRVCGQYCLPAALTEAEGKLVVTDAAADGPLERGDVLVQINGVDIAAMAEERARYYACSREEAILRFLLTSSPFFSRPLSRTEDIDILALRDGKEISLSVKGETREEYMAQGWTALPQKSHRLLEGNIGLINPGVVPEDGAAAVMDQLRNTEGLIVDMRQYPDMAWSSLLPEYLIEETQPTVVLARPSMAVPGTYVKTEVWRGYSPGYTRGVYYYHRPVVLLTDKSTGSQGEFITTICAAGEGVVTIGENTLGADGDVYVLPLPGGLGFTLSSLGVYTVDGQLTQRVGLTPDIPVSRTVQGIKEGRDELMEAAVEYIQKQSIK